MSPDVYKEIAAIIDGVVRKWRRHWLGERELKQEAWVAALTALPSWRPAKGPIGPYLGTVVRNRLGRYMLESGSAISARAHRPASVEALKVKRGPMPFDLSAEASIEESLDQARVSVRRVARLMELVGDEMLDDLVRNRRRGGHPSRQLTQRRLEALGRIVGDPELSEARQ